MSRWQKSQERNEGATVRVELASRIEMLETADVLASHLARVAGFDEDAIDDIRVAVDESVANAITHGNHYDGAKRVSIEFVFLPHAFVIRVRDEGTGFDPDGLPDPVARENLLKSSGRGILLMRSMMDDVHYSRTPDGGTETTLLKRLPDSSLAKTTPGLSLACAQLPVANRC